MRLSLIVAMSENRVIGRGGQLPWHLSSDLRRFKRLTMGHHMLMGRKTFESLGQLLPGRTTIVMTRQEEYELSGGLVVHDLEHAMRLAEQDDEMFVIGGGDIFRQALPMAEKLYITRVHAEIEGDVVFPDVTWNEWELIEQQHFTADERNDFDTTYCVYERRAAREQAGWATN
jgi:dihydrofolate reductase